MLPGDSTNSLAVCSDELVELVGIDDLVDELEDEEAKSRGVKL